MPRDPLADIEPLVHRVYAYVAYRIGDGPDAEDVTSATFERAVRYRDSYDPARGEPIGWLLGIARRCIASEATAPRATPLEHEVPSDEELDSAVQRRLALRDSVADLEPRDRELIALRYGADLRTAEIADLLDMTPNAVDVALHRALGRLRSTLEDSDVRPSVLRPARVHP